MSERGEYSPPAAIPAMSAVPLSCISELAAMTVKKKKCNNQKRFSDEQIKSLELMFETETRLEPRKKVQLARELGLQPRQVAIWFQNKRARWKSKQLEKEYNILKANYNNLASQCEALKKEKQALASELQRLNELMQKSQEEVQCCGQGAALSSTDHESDNGENARCEPEVKHENGPWALSDDDNNIKAEYFGLDEDPDLMGIVEPADSCLTSSDDWGGFKSDALLDQSSSSYPWWDFWS
ncbi:PREDICTED: homeobox-leucine zipper protein ATHB-7-like [Tarenaya hassleriana]|uniref:homeobox-leucine zipper protein ATHB-7-like n=1 Tax=Tarenaya hassleriana TaxID=28532 RepID=UPI00053C093D|nr:PREDICTED: homeobox-leucine zipper protein ATHB-7-like [Tarenaya hassleriana]